MANLNIRVDENVKSDFQKVCSNVGMDMTTAFTVFMKKTINENGIPFQVSADPFYSAENMERLDKDIAEVKAGKAKFITKTMAELEEMANEQY
ncbi:MAG: type II toxin-antitoxin system RelB/DinJ family antitoxin [Anaerovoracaceae bacterium]